LQVYPTHMTIYISAVKRHGKRETRKPESNGEPIYVVEPTSPIDDGLNVTDQKFPGNSTKSYRTREPLRVIGEVQNWEGHRMLFQWMVELLSHI